MKKTFFRALLCAAAGLIYAQTSCAQHSLTLSVDQPESPLVIDAGPDIRFDGAAARLGGDPTATGGSGDYTYRWEPAEYLDDPASANPQVIRLDRPVTFVLSVRDPRGRCEKQSEVYAALSPEAAKLASPEVTAFPNPFSDEVTFHSNTKVQSLTVTDMTGQLIDQIGIPEAENFRFETGNMAPGLYLFSIRFTDGSTTAKKLCKIY